MARRGQAPNLIRRLPRRRHLRLVRLLCLWFGEVRSKILLYLPNNKISHIIVVLFKIFVKVPALRIIAFIGRPSHYVTSAHRLNLEIAMGTKWNKILNSVGRPSPPPLNVKNYIAHILSSITLCHKIVPPYQKYDRGQKNDAEPEKKEAPSRYRNVTPKPPEKAAEPRANRAPTTGQDPRNERGNGKKNQADYDLMPVLAKESHISLPNVRGMARRWEARI